MDMAKRVNFIEKEVKTLLKDIEDPYYFEDIIEFLVSCDIETTTEEVLHALIEYGYTELM